MTPSCAVSEWRRISAGTPELTCTRCWTATCSSLTLKDVPLCSEERNRLVEEGKWTQPIARKRVPDPWPPEVVEKLRELHSQGLTIAEIAREIGKTKASVTAKSFRLFRRPVRHR